MMTDPRPSPGQILKQLCPAGPLIAIRRRPTGLLAGTVEAGRIIHTIRLITPAERAAAGLKPDQLVVELSDGTRIYPDPDRQEGVCPSWGQLVARAGATEGQKSSTLVKETLDTAWAMLNENISPP